jgi:hypothetical protein
MQREDILELILLEADGGLSLEESGLLETELARDPTLRDERTRIHSAWNDVRDLGRGLAMRPEFGESRLASLRAPRREGVIIGGHVRAAAAALLLATFARGSFDPRTSIVVDRFGPDANGAAVRSTASADETIRADSGESVVASSIDGLRVNLRNGGVSLNADGEMRIEPGPISADVMIGERAARIDLGGLELIGTQATLSVSGEFEDRQFAVLSGSLRLNDFTGRVFTRLDGEVRVGPDKSSAGFNPIASGNPLTDPETVPTRTETPIEVIPDEPTREHSDPTLLMNRSFAPAHLVGTITSASDGTAVAGAVVTLVRDLLPEDALKVLLPEDPELRLETRRDLDTARAVLGGAFTVTSDADGRFDIPRLPPGIWRIDIQAPEESRFADLRDRFFEVRAGEERALPLALDDGATAYGRIVDSKGRPVTNAILTRLERTIHTGSNGEFKFEHVSATDGRATIRANDFVLTDVDLSTLEFNAITLSRSIPIRGVIRDHVGTPMAGRIEAGFEVNGVWHVERTNVDVEGKFSLRTIPSGVAIRLVAGSRGYQIATRFLDPDASRADKFYLDLPTDRSVTVYPYDVAFGRPVSDAAVLAYGVQELLPGVEETVGFSLSGIDSDNDTAAIVCSAGLRFTTFSFAPNATEVHVEMQPARDRRVRVVDPSGNAVSDALVVWSARMNEDPRVLAVVPAIGLSDHIQLPDYGLDGGGLDAQIVVTSKGSTAVVKDDPTQDEIVVVVGGSDQ